MKAMKKDLAGVSPVIAVILMVAITVVLAGVVFLWAQSFTEGSGDTVKTLNIRVTLKEDTDVAGADKLDIEVLGGTIDWTKYKVTVDTAVWASNSGTSSAGDTKTFLLSTATPATVTLTSGTTYKVQIVDLENNKVAYTSENVIATSYDST